MYNVALSDKKRNVLIGNDALVASLTAVQFESHWDLLTPNLNHVNTTRVVYINWLIGKQSLIITMTRTLINQVATL